MWDIVYLTMSIYNLKEFSQNFSITIDGASPKLSRPEMGATGSP